MLPDKDGPSVGGGQSSPLGEDPSVSLFRDYLRLKTVHPEPDYGETPPTERVQTTATSLMCDSDLFFLHQVYHLMFCIRVHFLSAYL